MFAIRVLESLGVIIITANLDIATLTSVFAGGGTVDSIVESLE